MSADPATETQTAENTWQEIRELIAELARLAGTDIAPNEFYTAFLTRTVAALGAVGGAVWAREGEGPVQLACQIRLADTGLSTPENRPRHERLLQQALTGAEPSVVPPKSAAASQEGEAGNPSEFALLIVPLVNGRETFGVAEVFQRGSARPAALRGGLQFLRQAAALAGEYRRAREMRQLHARQGFWEQLEQFTRAVHVSLDPQRTCYVLANEGRQLIGCDRLSVTLSLGRRQRVEAVSGQDVLDRRASAIKLLGKLARTVASAGDPVWFNGEAEDLPPQVDRACVAFAEQTHAKTLAICPIQPPGADDDAHEPAAARRRRPRPIGVLVAEWYGASPAEGAQDRIEAVSQHGGQAVANAIAHHSVFLLPLWQALGWLLGVFRWRTLPKTLAVVGLVAAAIAALCLVPADFSLRGDGALQPEIRRNVFAPSDGVVQELFVEHGSLVEPGTDLVVLRNDELREKQDVIRGEIRQAQKELLSLARIPREDLKTTERARLVADEEELQERLRSLEQRKSLLENQIAQLQVTSPIAGAITTWNVRDTLSARPVARGDVLLSIADLTSEWVLEIRMPEERMGHVLAAQQALQKELPATFILATDPGNTYRGTIAVDKAALTAELDEQHGNSVLVTIRFDKRQFGERANDLLRPGAAVTAKIHCGQRAVGYVWFHEVYEFIQSKILFRLF